MTKNKNKKKLNPEQKKAVEYDDGPLVIVAGAGTGKTTVITERIAYLIEQKKAKSDEILALTFTDKAAGEMEERVDRKLPYGYVDLWIYTFHALCERILHESGLEIGISDQFKLLSQSEQAILIHKNFEDFKLDYYKPAGNPRRFIDAMVGHFSRCKDEVISPQDYIKFAKEFEHKNKKSQDPAIEEEVRRLKEIAQAYDTYQQLLLKNDFLDFGDLINYVIKLFRERPNVLKKYREQFKYILVDEFQDTNYAQYELVKMLAQPKNNITVCFDDDQSIYKFRGASVSNVLQFRKDFKSSQYITLTKNYRSYQEILDLSYKFIQQNNPNRLEFQLKNDPKFKDFSKKLISQNDDKAETELLYSYTLQGEAEKVVQKIIDLKNKDNSWGDFAILVRANSHAEEFINVLERHEIPYQFLAATGLYGKPIILDVLAYLRLLDNYHESSAVFRILSSPVFNLNAKDLITLNYWSKRKSWSLFETLEKQEVLEKISDASRQKISRFLSLIDKHSQKAIYANVSQILFDFVEDSGYLKLISKVDSKENADKISQLNQFFKKATVFEKNNQDKTTKNFVKYIDLIIESGDRGSGVTDITQDSPDSVKIMTIHSSKGLEFDYVFVVNLVNLRFPSMNRKAPIELPDDMVKEIVPEGNLHLEEERRLMYVAMTRAKKGLFFSWGKDYGGSRDKKPSRFIPEMGFDSDKEMTKEEETEVNKIDKLRNQNRVTKNDDQGINFVPPKKYSFTQLKAFESCPLQYKFQHVLHIPVRGRWNFSFGKTLHATLEKFFKKIIKDDYQLKLDLKDLLEIYEESWIDDWYLSKSMRQEKKKLGEEILSDFYVKIKEEGVPRVLNLELPFNFKIGKYTLRGAIDRVDRISDNKIRLVDYKTGNPKTEDDLKFADKEQLFIYQMAAKEIFRDEVESLSFVYLNDNTQVDFIGKTKDLEKMEDRIVSTIEKINQGKFDPKPNKHTCKFCDYKNICQFSQ